MTYLIVGASSGIGKSLSELLLAEGHEVIGTHFKNPIEHSGVQAMELDVLNDELNMDFLPDQIDGLVYCPGTIDLKPFHRIKPEDFINDFRLQHLGAVKMIQATLDRLKKANQASVVLFSIVAVQNGFPFHAQVASSKGAIEGLTRSLAAEFAPKIRVNAIAPSLTQTPLSAKLLSSDEKVEANDKRHPLKRIGQAEDIAQMAAFLLQERSSWISGQVFSVDGGMSRLKV